jgi:hypothetical protein
MNFNSEQLPTYNYLFPVLRNKTTPVIKIKNYSFSELADEYVKWAERQGGFKKKVSVIKRLANEFGHYPLRRFDTRMIEQFQTDGLQKEYKPATVNRHIATLKHNICSPCTIS